MTNLQETNYTGWKKWYPTDKEWADFYTEGLVPFDLLENEYLIVYDSEHNATYYCCEHGKLRQLRGGSLKFEIKRDMAAQTEVYEQEGKKYTKKQSTYNKPKANVITPRNDEQVLAFDLLNNDSITVKLLSGNFGSGKTMLATYAALQMLNEGKVEKIVWLRNNIQVAGTEAIGFLPGSEFDKIKPFVMPFIDHLKSEQRVMKLIENEQLEVPALGFIRGRNIENACIICSEAQNLTEDLVKLIIGRVGEGSYLIFDGDFKHQVDRNMFEKSPGLKRMIEVLAGDQLFGYVDLPKSERSATARLADKFDK